ncbi:MAG: hypothetical protein WCD44_00085 [Candidatus Babeliales bacterium]
MINLKNKLKHIVITIFLPCSLLADNINNLNIENFDTSDKSNYSLNFDNDLFLDDDDDPFINEFLDTVGSNLTTRQIEPFDIITLLCQIGAKKILETPFFLRTNSLNQRSLLDEPIFEPDRCYFANPWIIGFHIFARKKDRSNFNFDCTNLDSFLALREPTLLGLLENTIDIFKELLDRNLLDINRIFSLVSTTTVEERRGGFMFHVMRQWQDKTLRIFFPFYYLQSNYSISKENLDLIAEEFGISGEPQEDNFIKRHFISDAIGIGDTRVELDFDLIENKAFAIRLGGLVTIPTAFKWGAGFKGTNFPKPSTFPAIDFEALFQLAENPSEANLKTAISLLSNILLGALDRISADLLDTTLGNGGHLGLGVFLRSYVPLYHLIGRSWTKNLTYASRISVEYLFPGTQKRFFINKINEQEFDRDFENPDDAQENLIFLEEKFIERIYLRAFDTKIQPGIIFRWTSKLCHQGKKWGFNIGTDFWMQDKEKFRSINTFKKTLKQLDIKKAIPPVAYQGKIFGSIVYKAEQPTHTWFISLNADYTTTNKGLGDDYGVSLNIETMF